MINRAGNKEKAKRVLNENGNLSGMVGMEILYRVIAAITSVLLGAMIAGGIGVVSAVVSAPFKLFGLAGIIIAYVLITPIATLVGAIAGGAVAGPFEVARYRYYLSLRKNGIRPKVTCIFDAFDFFMQFALVTGVRMLTIMWIPVLIQFATLLLAAVVAAASRSYQSYQDHDGPVDLGRRQGRKAIHGSGADRHRLRSGGPGRGRQLRRHQGG